MTQLCRTFCPEDLHSTSGFHGGGEEEPEELEEPEEEEEILCFSKHSVMVNPLVLLRASVE